jgi:hypothetical protein
MIDIHANIFFLLFSKQKKNMKLVMMVIGNIDGTYSHLVYD